ncbi:MAG: proteasome activator [Actinomycetota bacterium]|nr:proteasome activator [Actinomycetota bacterium]
MERDEATTTGTDDEATRDRVRDEPVPDGQPADDDRPDDTHGDETGTGVAAPNVAELLRLTGMLRALVSEAREVPLDDAGRARLLEVHRRATDSVRGLVPEALGDELTGLGLPADDDELSAPELRVAQAQLVGWLTGTVQSIQAEMAAEQQHGGARPPARLSRSGAGGSEPDRSGQYL